MVIRILLALLVLPLWILCLWGLLASFEPGVSPAWKIGYGSSSVVLLAVILWLVAGRRRQRAGARAEDEGDGS